MATKKTNRIDYPEQQFGVWESDGEETYLTTNDTLETLVKFNGEPGETMEVAVYTFDKVIKIKKEASYKIVK